MIEWNDKDRSRLFSIQKFLTGKFTQVSATTWISFLLRFYSFKNKITVRSKSQWMLKLLKELRGGMFLVIWTCYLQATPELFLHLFLFNLHIELVSLFSRPIQKTFSRFFGTIQKVQAFNDFLRIADPIVSNSILWMC